MHVRNYMRRPSSDAHQIREITGEPHSVLVRTFLRCCSSGTSPWERPLHLPLAVTTPRIPGMWQSCRCTLARCAPSKTKGSSKRQCRNPIGTVTWAAERSREPVMVAPYRRRQGACPGSASGPSRSSRAITLARTRRSSPARRSRRSPRRYARHNACSTELQSHDGAVVILPVIVAAVDPQRFAALLLRPSRCRRECAQCCLQSALRQRVRRLNAALFGRRSRVKTPFLLPSTRKTPGAVAKSAKCQTCSPTTASTRSNTR